MNTEPKFTKETHRARNGVGIDFIGWYPNYDEYYPYGVTFSNGVTESIAENGKVYDNDNEYDLVPIVPACPFSPETHVRADGVEIRLIRPSPCGDSSFMVRFMDSLTDLPYSIEGKNIVYSSDKYDIITREEYAARKAAEPFTVDNCRTRDGRKVHYLHYLPKDVAEECGYEKVIFALIEYDSQINWLDYDKDGYYTGVGEFECGFDLIKI